MNLEDTYNKIKTKPNLNIIIFIYNDYTRCYRYAEYKI